MQELLQACPSCGNSNFIHHLTAKDHLVTNESFDLVKCSTCTLVFTNPRPSIDNIKSYYDSNAYLSHHRSFTVTGVAYSIAKFFTLKWKHSIIKKQNSGVGSLLDFGCGTGDFLQKAKSKGWQISGLEVDRDARQQAENKTKVSVASSLDNVSGLYDIITLWHVLEHIHNLQETLRVLANHLNSNGKIIIAVPNLNSFDSSYYGHNWAGLDVPRHLYHFTPASFKSLAIQSQLIVTETIPMKLDAYYVSILSEKNLTGGTILNGLLTGFKSNQRAKDSKQYSSLIYILRK